MSSTKLPTLARAPTRLSGRRCEKGPTLAPASTTDSRSRQWSRISAPGPTSTLTRRTNGPITARARTVVRPSRMVNGRSTAPASTTTSSPTSVLAGSSTQHAQGRERTRAIRRRAHGSVGATRAWNAAASRSGSKSASRRACARLAGLAWIADLSAFSAPGASPARACAAARQ